MLPDVQQQRGILSQVSDWLKLLGLVILVAELIVLSAMRLTSDAHPLHAWYPVFMLLFLVVIVVGVFYDRYLDSLRVPVLPPPEPVEDPATDSIFGEQMAKITANVHQVPALGSPVLIDEVRFELDSLVVNSRNWSRGELHGSVERYQSVLLRLYSEARASIFSTTVRDYLDRWQDELLEGMIEASERSSAKDVVRVFVFSRREEIDERAIEILRRFENSRVRGLVYIDQEDEKFSFPPEVTRDFVVIDGGDAIGVTLSHEPGQMRAQWSFGDDDKANVLGQVCESLERASKGSKDVIEWWERTLPQPGRPKSGSAER